MGQGVLERVFVSRAYTCHQLLEATRGMLGPLAKERPAPLAMVLHVDHLFHDEDLPLHERRWLFDRIADGVAGLHRRGLPVVLTVCPAGKGGKSGEENEWARRLGRVATVEADPERMLARLEGGRSESNEAGAARGSGAGPEGGS